MYMYLVDIIGCQQVPKNESIKLQVLARIFGSHSVEFEVNIIIWLILDTFIYYVIISRLCFPFCRLHQSQSRREEPYMIFVGIRLWIVTMRQPAVFWQHLRILPSICGIQTLENLHPLTDLSIIWFVHSKCKHCPTSNIFQEETVDWIKSWCSLT